jgi:hypothetical protein
LCTQGVTHITIESDDYPVAAGCCQTTFRIRGKDGENWHLHACGDLLMLKQMKVDPVKEWRRIVDA